MADAAPAVSRSREEAVQALRSELQRELQARISRRARRTSSASEHSANECRAENECYAENDSAAAPAIDAVEECAFRRSQLQAGRSIVGCQAAEVRLGSTSQKQTDLPVIATGLRAFDQALPDGGVPFGAVTEIRVKGAGLATTLALSLCRSLHQQGAAARQSGLGHERWCAYVDPQATLFAPGVFAQGVCLERLLVLQPAESNIKKAAIMLAEANAFSLIIVDLRGHGLQKVNASAAGKCVSIGKRIGLGHTRKRPLSFANPGSEQATIRRLNMAVRHVKTSVVLLTQQLPHQSMPLLPVALRLEVSSKKEFVQLLVGKDRLGRISSQPTQIPIANLCAPGPSSARQAQALESDFVPLGRKLESFA